MESPSFNRFLSNRPYLNETTINKRYTFKRLKSDNVIEGAGHYLKKNYKPSWTCLRHQFKSRLPVVNWLRNYDVRENLLKDIVCGITMGIIEIPQSMGYSLMAGLPAVNGLYVCFFSAIMYFFFGTSRHMSIGTYGIVALMLDTYLVAFDGVLFPTEGAHKMGPAMTNAAGLLPTMPSTSHTSHIPLFFTKHARMTNPDPIPPSKDVKLFNKLKVISGDFVSDDRDEARVMIASCFSFYVGIFQIVFALLHAGVATKFLSDTVIAAFTTGAAYHVVASELHSLLGVKVGHTYGFFKIAEFLIEVFKNITTINLATCIISAFCLFELYMVKHFINHKYRAKLFAPVPIELIVIVLATLFTYLFRFDLRFGVSVIGDVPLGMPTPKVPPLYLFPKIYDNVIELSLVSFALNISMAKLFAKKNNYEIRPNQEFFAYGVGNLLNSFFRGFPSSVGISRCVILDDIGARSLLHAAISSTIILIVILIVGFLMRWLPIACLASLIVVALIPMLFEVKRVVPLFKRSKIEGLAWMATFLSVVIIDVDFGLYVGIAAGLLLFIIQKQRANSFLMGNIPDTDIYEAINICDEAVEIEGIKIIRYESSIFYANVDNFVYRIFKLSGLNPNDVIEAMKKKREQFAKDKRRAEHMKKKMKIPSPNSTEDSQTPINIIGSVNESSETSENLLKRELSNIIEESVKIKDIIIDFSCVNLIDTMGLDALVQVNEAYKQIGVQLHLSHCKRNLIKRLNKTPLKNNFSSDFIYPTTHDAVLHIIFSRSNSHIGGDVGGLGNDAIVHSLIFADENANYPHSNDLSIGLDPIYYAKRGDNINYSALEHVAFEV